jgi:AraC-like DNA-binding protein
MSTGKTIAETAYQPGFEHPPYFSRLFKKEVGLTPMRQYAGCSIMRMLSSSFNTLDFSGREIQQATHLEKHSMLSSEMYVFKLYGSCQRSQQNIKLHTT